MSIAAIILAAGASRRLGQPKQLLKVNGETLLERALRLVLETGAEPVLTVLGAHRDAILSSVQLGHTITVVNDNWKDGLASSIHAGLKVLESDYAEASGALLMVCDQPRLTADHLSLLLATFTAASTPTIVASRYGTIVGIPTVFPRIAFSELHGLRGDRGARAVLENPPCAMVSLLFNGGEIDVDSPSDIAGLG